MVDNNAWNFYIADTIVAVLIVTLATLIVLEHKVFRPNYAAKISADPHYGLKGGGGAPSQELANESRQGSHVAFDTNSKSFDPATVDNLTFTNV